MGKDFLDVITFGLGGLILDDLTKAPKSPASTAPATPSQSTANTTAASTVADQRAAMLNAGGVTDYTGGLGILTGNDVEKTSLVGG